MPYRIKSLIQYLLLLAVAVALVWYSLRAISPTADQSKWQYLAHTWSRADKGWLMLMALLAMISHVLRAERWRMLIEPTGHTTSLYNSFLSLMIGYLVNLVVPRGGEVTRCYNLYKLDRCPFDKTFGTVVAERAIDLLCFALILLATFAVESDKLLGFIYSLPLDPISGASHWLTILIMLGALVILIAFGFWIIARNVKFKEKILQFWLGFKNGLGTVLRLKNPYLFYFYSFIIWVLYFAMSYTVIKAFDETSHLGWSAILSVFAIGSIAMIIPLPGGTGSYHTLVPAGLTFLYHIPKADAVAFTFVFHAWQTLIMVVGGFLALLSTYLVLHFRKTNSG
ncbi:MAG: flippase-like domain-containing protein [Flammeovirgaceae bacterium]|nr:MAG: flippase-like domain-containing protein [Flammeovirgaceae bacterium]